MKLTDDQKISIKHARTRVLSASALQDEIFSKLLKKLAIAEGLEQDMMCYNRLFDIVYNSTEESVDAEISKLEESLNNKPYGDV
jgi:DNA polymerase III delta prime subunit